MLGSSAFGQIISSPAPPQVEAGKSVSGDASKVYDYPEEMPDFPDGINAFRNKFIDALVLDHVKNENGENTLKGLVSFVVERDGTISDIEVRGSNISFNTEVKNAVKSIKDRWKPAKHEGRIVRSKFRIPLTINFK